MNPTVKTILVWVLILFAAVGLWNLVESSPGRMATFSFTEFLDRVDNGQVTEVTLTGSTLTGRLRNNQSFQSAIPTGYTAVYERLIEKKVKVTVIPTDQQAWLTNLVLWLVPMLLMFGLGWLCARRFHPQPPALLTI